MKAIRKGDWVRFRKSDAYHLGIVERRNSRWVYFNSVRGSVVEARPGELVVVPDEEILDLVRKWLQNSGSSTLSNVSYG